MTCYPAPSVSRRVRLAIFVLLACFAVTSGSAADKKIFNVPADIAENSLKRFSAQSGLEVLFATKTAGIVRTNDVRGELTPQEAIDWLLASTGLIAARDPATGAFTISSF